MLSVPFIRWANTAFFSPNRGGVEHRQIYDHEFVYVLEGRGEIVLNGRVYPASSDCLFLVQPQVYHSFRASSQEDFLVIGVHFDWAPHADSLDFAEFRPVQNPVEFDLFRAPQGIRGWNLEKTPFLELAGRLRVRKMLENVVAEYGRGDAESRPIAGALLAATIGQIEREVRLLKELQTNSAIGADAVRRVQKARERLEMVGETALSIEEVARQVGWSADHLRRMFRAVLNSSPHQIQNAARLRRAKELLRYESLPISEIAARCGFADAGHFSRVFRRETGFAPREWVGLTNSFFQK